MFKRKLVMFSCLAVHVHATLCVSLNMKHFPCFILIHLSTTSLLPIKKGVDRKIHLYAVGMDHCFASFCYPIDTSVCTYASKNLVRKLWKILPVEDPCWPLHFERWDQRSVSLQALMSFENTCLGPPGVIYQTSQICQIISLATLFTSKGLGVLPRSK